MGKFTSQGTAYNYNPPDNWAKIGAAVGEGLLKGRELQLKKKAPPVSAGLFFIGRRAGLPKAV